MLSNSTITQKKLISQIGYRSLQFLAISVLIFLSSCSTVYLPTSQTVPLFEEKNQAVVSGAVALGDQSAGLDIQGAYALTDHLAFMANGYFGQVYEDGTVKLDTNFITIDRNEIPYNNFELGVGYFTHLGESEGIFEIYGGWGTGGPRNTNQDIRDAFRNNHFFLQPNFGGRFGAVDFAFSTRINYVVWADFSETLIEPGLTLRFGWENIKFQLQGLLSFPLDGSTANLTSNGSETVSWFEVFHSSFGIYIPIQFNAK